MAWGANAAGRVRAFLAHRFEVRSYFLLLLPIIVLVAFLPVAGVFVSLIIGGLLALFVIGLAVDATSDSTKQSLEGLAALMSCIALVFAGYWYFIERRGIPKLNVDPQIQVWPVGDGQAFVRVELRMENVGTSKIELHPDDKIRIEVGQVLPLAGKQARGLQADFKAVTAEGGKAFAMLKTDKWPLRASFTDGIDTVIESGETERIFFKGIIPCHDGLVAIATAEVPKKLNWPDSLFDTSGELLYWKGQVLSDRIETCSKKGDIE